MRQGIFPAILFHPVALVCLGVALAAGVLLLILGRKRLRPGACWAAGVLLATGAAYLALLAWCAVGFGRSGGPAEGPAPAGALDVRIDETGPAGSPLAGQPVCLRFDFGAEGLQWVEETLLTNTGEIAVTARGLEKGDWVRCCLYQAGDRETPLRTALLTAGSETARFTGLTSRFGYVVAARLEEGAAAGLAVTD